jgi:hypothetical protein
MTSLTQTWFWQQWHLVLVLSLITLIALNFLSRFVLPALQLKERLAEVLGKLQSLKTSSTHGAVDLDKLESEVMTEPRMAHLWAQYAHCLHVPWDDIQAGQNAAGPQNRVRVLSELFFNAMKAKSGGAVVDLTDIESKVAGDPQLSSLWAEYSEALDKRNELPDPSNRKARRWRASALAETFFSDYALVDSPLRSDFYKHVPGILTGLGIIGTFSGLINGLVHFDVSDPATTQAQLSLLVQTVGQAFFVSALAIALAMLFTWVEKALLSARYSQVEALQHLIDSLFEAGSGQENLERLVVATEAQVAVMQDVLAELRRTSSYLAAMK